MNKIKKYIIVVSVIILVIVLSAILILQHSHHEHHYNEATCTSPKICTICKKIEGEKLEHQWEDATCEVPKTCIICGEKEGEKVKHEWKEANCIRPKACILCGETEGEKLDHIWKEATCSSSKTCTICGLSEGGRLEHTWNETKSKCIVCGRKNKELCLDEIEHIDETIKEIRKNGIEDEYFEYIDSEDFENYQTQILDNLIGIGVYLIKDESTGNVVVYSTVKGAPAEKSGIQSGDIIIGVDNEKVVGMDTEEVAKRLKGKEGTEVVVNIKRNGNRKEITVKRQVIQINCVETKMLEDNIGYILLQSFDKGCAKEFEKGMDLLISSGAQKVIIDLRNNSGGLVDESLEILDLFLDKDQITLFTKSVDGTEEINRASGNKKYNLSLAVLVNNYTASASEIVVGALKDNKKAVIIGNKTYGKGVIQTLYKLSDGSAVKITTHEYFTPNKYKINGRGIIPDYEIEVKGADDLQLKKAKKILK